MLQLYKRQILTLKEALSCQKLTYLRFMRGQARQHKSVKAKLALVACSGSP